MKILWIINSPFPEAYEELKTHGPVTVGWVYSAAKQYVKHHENDYFGVASFYPGKKLKKINKGGMVHFLLPRKVDNEIKHYWKRINNQFMPDLIHIHGTEYPHSFSFVEACGSKNVVVSIQGMVSVIEKYYFGGIRNFDLLKSVTLRDLVRFDTLFSQRRNMRLRGRFEKLLLENVDHVIGRTSWDQSHLWAINPGAKYHFCNETLRPSFYENEWSLEKCEKHSIFISQAHYPLKGFHQVLKALPIVLQHYPNTKVFVAGNDFFTNKGFRLSGYGNYINRLISKSKLSNHIFFTGLLNEDQMCRRFLKSHVFVCPSSIENSPNAVGEAQLLGVPCIASYVGGTPDMIKHGESGLLYRFEEIEMLASNICRIFSDHEFAKNLSENGRVVAAKRHDRNKNVNDLSRIYLKITGQNED